MKIAGRRTGETYPEAPRSSSSGGGSILSIGEVTNTAIVIEAGPAVDIPGLEIDFADWTAGDVLVVEYWCGASQNDEAAVDVIFSVIPLFDVGAGFAQLDSSGGPIGISVLTLGAQTIGFQLSSSVSVACPVAPKVKLQGANGGGNIIVSANSCILRAYRIPASLFIAGPAGVLPP